MGNVIVLRNTVEVETVKKLFDDSAYAKSYVEEYYEMVYGGDVRIYKAKKSENREGWFSITETYTYSIFGMMRLEIDNDIYVLISHASVTAKSTKDLEKCIISSDEYGKLIGERKQEEKETLFLLYVTIFLLGCLAFPIFLFWVAS